MGRKQLSREERIHQVRVKAGKAPVVPHLIDLGGAPLMCADDEYTQVDEQIRKQLKVTRDAGFITDFEILNLVSSYYAFIKYKRLQLIDNLDIKTGKDLQRILESLRHEILEICMAVNTRISASQELDDAEKEQAKASNPFTKIIEE